MASLSTTFFHTFTFQSHNSSTLTQWIKLSPTPPPNQPDTSSHPIFHLKRSEWFWLLSNTFSLTSKSPAQSTTILPQILGDTDYINPELLQNTNVTGMADSYPLQCQVHELLGQGRRWEKWALLQMVGHTAALKHKLVLSQGHRPRT